MKRAQMLIVLLLLALSELPAQVTTGEIRGVVRDTAGAGLAGVQVQVTGALLLGVRRVVTRSDGSFTILAIPPGTVSVRVLTIGFRPTVVDSVQVFLGAVTRVPDVTLGRAVLELGETRIVAGAVALDPDNATIGATLATREISGLPTDRDYTSVISILPHANRSSRGDAVNVGGATGAENAYFVDGVNLTDPVRSASGTQLPYNFIRAVEVKSGGYEAQYGRALGGLVNAITYSGSNDLEVNGFAFVTTDALTADARTEPSFQARRTLNYDVGVRVGGPIARDRLWYSAAYNPRIGEVDRRVATFGTFTDRRTAHVFASKLSWAASPSTSMELSVFGDPTTHAAVDQSWLDPTLVPTSATPFLTERLSGGVMASLSMTTVVRGAMVEASLARAMSRNVLRNADAATLPFSYQDNTNNTVEGGWPEWSDGDLARTTARVRTTLTRGRHTWMAGAELDRAAERGSIGQRNIDRISPTSWTELEFFTEEGNLRNLHNTLFIQDRWHLSEFFTLNVGLRWSAQTLTGARNTVAQRFENEWQPRLGFVWLPTADVRHRVVGSYGRFYQQSALWLSGGRYSDQVVRMCTYSSDPRVPGTAPDSCTGGAIPFDPAAVRVPDAALEHLDEFALGYERMIAANARTTVRVVRRDLRSSFHIGYNFNEPNPWLLGTPGKGAFSYLPPPRREYTALELAAEGAASDVVWRGSYVLSRSYGNYPGAFDAAFAVATPGFNRTFATPDQAENSTGLLPNDRTHVLKGSISVPLRYGVSAGVVASWSSGTPVNSFAPCSCGATWIPDFVLPRGTAGRTPSVWTFDLRLARDVRLGATSRGRVLVDVLNLGSPQAAVWLNEFAYSSNAGGTPSGPRSDFKRPLAYQPPTLMRIGLEVTR